MKSKVLLIFILFSFSLYSQVMEYQGGKYLEKTIILKVKPEYRAYCKDNNIDIPQLQKIFQDIEVKSISKMFPLHKPPRESKNKYGFPLVDLSLIYRVEYNKNVNIGLILNSIEQTGIVEYAELYPIAEILYIPNDPQINQQYALSITKAFQAWDVWKGDTNFVVGITDTGYDFTHPDLVNACKYNYDDPIDSIDNDNDGYVDNFMGWNTGDWNNNPQYLRSGHGVHVAGIAGASTDNGFGMAGIGFKTKLLPVKIDNSAGVLSKTYEGIIYAADHGAKVINCSWGSSFGHGQFGQDIVNYATYNREALVVAACGNSNNERMFYPASYKNTLCVAATNDKDLKWPNSSYYERVDISAPGQDVFSTWGNGSFIKSSGTSMASPLVAGAAALVWSYYPDFLPMQIHHHLKNTADSIYHIGNNNEYFGKLGSGRLNVYRALTDTFKPGLSALDIRVTDNNDNILLPLDTVNIRANFINYLGETKNLRIKLTSNSPYITMIDSVLYFGKTKTLETFNNFDRPFRFRINKDIPNSYSITLYFRFYDDNYYNYEFFNVTANRDYLTLDTNNIKVTITSKSVFGYNDNFNYKQGIGLVYGSSNSLISCAGLMIGESTKKVADNVYGFSEAFENDFRPYQKSTYIIPPKKGDKQIYCAYSDTSILSTNIGLFVNQHTYAYNKTWLENFIIVEYEVINASSIPLNNIYIGIFADWDLDVFEQNKCETNKDLRLGYVYALNKSIYAGIQLLNNNYDFKHYAIDNDGQDASINLKDGFSSIEKYQALSGNRISAGNSEFGNNVSQVVGAGPFFIAPSDTVKIAFAIHVANSLPELELSAKNALRIFYGPEPGINENENSKFIIYPQITSSEINICDKELSNTYLIYDILGRCVMKLKKENNCQLFDISLLNNGLYLIKEEKGHTTAKFFKQ